MNEAPPNTQSSIVATWLKNIKRALMFKPESSGEMLEVLQEAQQNNVFDSQALQMMEGALSVSKTQADEIMVPRPQVTFLKYEQNPQDLLNIVVRSGHSRFPVIGDDMDDIKGILLAKSFLPLLLKNNVDLDDFNLDDAMRPAHIVPETKQVDDLLHEFRETRNHMAIVVDEYGGVAGLVTIEDVLEEIVGEIEDETDSAEDNQFIRKTNKQDFLVKALTPIDEFNTFFNSSFNDDEYETVGGLLIKHLGHLPSNNESIELDRFNFRVLKADARQIHSLRVSVIEPKTASEDAR